MTMEIVPKMEAVSKSIESDLAEINEAADLVEAMQVENQKDLEVAVQFTATIKESYSELDEKRQSWTAPLRKVIEDINATFKPALSALDEIEDRLKKKIDLCVDANAEKRRALLSQVSATSGDQRQAIIKEADNYVIDKVPGMSIRKSYRGEVIDKQKIIQWALRTGQLQFISVDEKALNQLTKELGEKTDVPGWDVKEKHIVAISKGK